VRLVSVDGFWMDEHPITQSSSRFVELVGGAGNTRLSRERSCRSGPAPELCCGHPGSPRRIGL
jgi:hypothetical protein